MGVPNFDGGKTLELGRSVALLALRECKRCKECIGCCWATLGGVFSAQLTIRCIHICSSSPAPHPPPLRELSVRPSMKPSAAASCNRQSELGHRSKRPSRESRRPPAAPIHRGTSGPSRPGLAGLRLTGPSRPKQAQASPRRARGILSRVEGGP
jgi:hypothetical protein